MSRRKEHAIKCEIKYDIFNIGQYNAKSLTNEFMRRCNESDDSFDKLLYAWISFNCWATFVTGLNRDSDVISALSKSGILNGEFYELYKNNIDFKNNVNSFFNMFPVFDGRSYRKEAHLKQKDIPNNRNGFDKLGEEMGIKYSPRNWHAEKHPTWEDCIWAIYQVRCNLFHGQKDPTVPGDANMVDFASFILENFINLSNCYTWKSQESVTLSEAH